MGRQQAESPRVTSKVAQKCCKSKKSVFWHPQRHASSRNIKTFVLPHKTSHLRVDSSHIWTQLRGGLSPIVEMVMGETQSHVSRLGRLRKAPESGQSGPRCDLSGYSGALCLYTPSLGFVECSRDKELPRNSHNSIVGPEDKNFYQIRIEHFPTGWAHTMKRKGERLAYLKTAGLTLRETSHPGSVPSSD